MINELCRSAIQPLYPGGQSRQTELILVATCQGRRRILELVSIRPDQQDFPEEEDSLLYMIDHPTELFALAWKFLILGFQATFRQSKFFPYIRLCRKCAIDRHRNEKQL